MKKTYINFFVLLMSLMLLAKCNQTEPEVLEVPTPYAFQVQNSDSTDGPDVILNPGQDTTFYNGAFNELIITSLNLSEEDCDSICERIFCDECDGFLSVKIVSTDTTTDPGPIIDPGQDTTLFILGGYGSVSVTSSGSSSLSVPQKD